MVYKSGQDDIVSGLGVNEHKPLFQYVPVFQKSKGVPNVLSGTNIFNVYGNDFVISSNRLK